jgi:hypothetical protein
MPIDHIAIDPNQAGAIYAAEAEAVIRDVRRAYDRVSALKEKLDHSTDGSNFTAVATKVGTPAGTGTTIYNLFAGTKAALEDADVQALISGVGKG